MPNDSYRPLKTEQDEERLTPTPRREALAAPTPDIFDEPTRCLRINKEWFSHISGMIDTLSSPELWLGDAIEQSRALRQIAKLLVAPDCEDILQDVRFNLGTCSFEKKINDVWSVMEGGDDWLDCVPSGGGGGSGGAAVKVFTWEHRLVSAVVTASTSFVDAISFNYTPSYSNMLVIFSNASIVNSGSGHTELKILFNSLAGVDNNQVGAVQLAGGRVMSVADRFEGITTGVAQAIKLQIRTSAAGNATLLTNSDIIMTVIEYEDISAVFVEDVRIVSRELQKKIGGAWIPVSDSLATILNAIEAKADSAIATNVTQGSQIANIVTVNNNQNSRLDVLENDMTNVQSVASSAYSIATGAVTVNNAQQTQINTATSTNNTQDTRLNLIESNLSTAQGTIATHTSQITNLAQSVGVLNFDGAWAHSFDFTIDDYGWGLSDAGSGYVAGQGWLSNALGLRIGITGSALAENQVTHACARVKMLDTPLVGIEFAWTIQDGDLGSLLYGGVGGQSIGWLRVRNSASGTTSTGHLFVDFQPFGDFYLTGLTFLGRGFHNPFL